MASKDQEKAATKGKGKGPPEGTPKEAESLGKPQKGVISVAVANKNALVGLEEPDLSRTVLDLVGDSPAQVEEEIDKQWDRLGILSNWPKRTTPFPRPMREDASIRSWMESSSQVLFY